MLFIIEIQNIFVTGQISKTNPDITQNMGIVLIIFYNDNMIIRK